VNIHFPSTFHNSPIPTAFLDKNGNFLQANEAWEDLVGYSRVELESMNFANITARKDLFSDLRMVDLITSGKIDSYSMIKTYVNKDKTKIIIKLFVTVVRDDEGNFLHFTAWAVPLFYSKVQNKIFFLFGLGVLAFIIDLISNFYLIFSE